MTDAPARRRVLWLVSVALVFGGLNLIKPIHIDDGAYFYYARQIAARPLDPYGFYLIWYQEPNTGNAILAPPLLPYTWALALRLVGDSPALCKLLLLPWPFLLVFAVHSLARRFAPGVELPVTIITILSPALWPAANLMLDVPVLALGLTAVAVFLHACDRGSFFLAVAAGLLAGLAFETKYTACVAVAAILWASVLRRRPGLGTAAVLTTAHVFCGWEFLTALLYGRSHFFNRFTHGGKPDSHRLVDALLELFLTKGPLFTSLLSVLGGVTPALLLLGLAALGVRRRWLVMTAILFLGCVVAVALFDSSFTGSIAPAARIFGAQEPPRLYFELADVFFIVFGSVLLVVAGVVTWKLFRSSNGAARREVMFLSGWLLLEIVAYFPLTDFPAVRRVLGIIIVLTLLFGRYVSRVGVWSLDRAPTRGTLYAVVAFGVALGCALFALDFREAVAEKEGAERVAAWIRDHGGGRVWYAGHWGWQYYAEHQEMRPIVPDYKQWKDDPPPTLLERGDWVVLPDERIDQQKFRLEGAPIREAALLTFDDPVPLRTVPAFHGGTVAIQHQEEPRLRVRIFRVERDFVPQPRPRE
jgi:hypothetical protein